MDYIIRENKKLKESYYNIACKNLDDAERESEEAADVTLFDL